MSKKCDNTSVAVIARDPDCRNSSLDRILLIERKKYNPGFALVAGHQDGDNSEKAAKKELFEEVGLSADFLRPRLLITLNNPCKREGGSYHRWEIFIAEKWSGNIKKSENEVKNFIWADKVMIKELASRLEKFAEENKLSVDNKHLSELVKATNESESWKRSPGLEPPMYVLFKELGII